MSTTVAPRLAVEQWPTALAMAAGGAWSLLPHTLRDRVQGTDRIHTARVDPGSDRNLDAFATWAGAPAERYRGLVPPVSAARWAMPLVARLSAMAPHPLLKVLNQGARFRVARPLPRGPLALTGQLVEVREEDGRVRIHTQVTARSGDDGSHDGPALTLDVFAAVVTGRRTAPRPAPTDPGGWRTVGTWSASPGDGRDFFRLTGDFNPIHTSATFARRTRFGGPILHGFGTLARSQELLVDVLGPLRELDVRFVAPVPLPTTPIAVELAGDDTHLRVTGPDGTVHLAGRVASETRGPAVASETRGPSVASETRGPAVASETRGPSETPQTRGPLDGPAGAS